MKIFFLGAYSDKGREGMMASSYDARVKAVSAKALSKLDPMALFYSGTLAPIYTGIDTWKCFGVKSQYWVSNNANIFITVSTPTRF